MGRNRKFSQQKEYMQLLKTHQSQATSSELNVIKMSVLIST